MIEDIGSKFEAVSSECARVPKTGISLSEDFVQKYTAYIKSGQKIPGGFTDVAFDPKGATLQGKQLTPISNYGFVIAYKLSNFYILLREYEDRFRGIYSDKTNSQRREISVKLRDGDAAEEGDLRVRVRRLPADEQPLVTRFLTDYKWWRGGKEVGRSNDFFHSSLLKCANLVAAANGAIPSLAVQFAENQDLYTSFAFSIGTESLTIKVEDIDNKSKDELIAILRVMEADGQTKSSAYRVLGLKYPNSISRVGAAKILSGAGLSANYYAEIDKGVKLHTLIKNRKWGLSFYDGSFTNGGDRLSVALKIFAEKRKEEEWCSDKTDGDANKPRAGYVANKQLRVLSNTPADIGKLNGDVASNIKAWFKNYWNVADGKSWLEGLSDADLSGFGPYIAHLLQPGSPAVAKPAKFSNALEAAVKAVIKPEETGLYDERVNETLKFLGLIGFDWNENFDADDLGEAVNAQRVIKRRLKDMGIKRIQESPTADDGHAPDYLTVNEFLWFVNKNLNAIEKQVLEGKMVAAKHEPISSTEKTRKPKCDMSSHDDVLLLRLRAALRTKPFAILAGHSGTGKSRMVRQLAYMTCNDAALRKDEKGNPAKDPGNFCMVQVKPNWHDSGDLLGYYSELGKRYRASDFVKFIVKAYAYPDTPFFVCLDEMNLAPVEQYFAEYLSAIESRKIQKVKVLKGNPLAEADDETVVSDELIPRSAYVEGEEANRVIHYDWLGCELKESEHWIANYGLTIPRNLFVVGTVNMDESTNQFSRKVLDRAMTLEMTDADFKSFGKKGLEPSYDNYMGDDAVADLLAGKIQAEKLEDHQIRNLNALKTVLGATSFAVAYRFANEYALYETSLKETQTKTDTTSVPTPVAGAPAPASAVNAGQAAAPATPPPDGETAAAAPAEAVPTEAVPAIPAKPLAFDDMILMKVLPRISGEDVVVRRIFFGENGKFSDPKSGSLLELVQKGGTDTESVRKIKAIDERGGAYLSFWP